jgi:hypothetical protein
MPLIIPNVPRCQHLKVNGIQCGSPALRRNRFCFFHKRFQEDCLQWLERVQNRHLDISLFVCNFRWHDSRLVGFQSLRNAHRGEQLG